MQNSEITLQELQVQEGELIMLLNENRKQQRKITEVEFCKKHGFNVGDTVEYLEGGSLNKAQISDFEYSANRPWKYKGLLLNQDGKGGKREVIIWKTESMKPTTPQGSKQK